YRAARGPYAERAVTMLVTTAIFWTLVVQHQARMMKVDGTAWSPSEWRGLFVYLFIEPGGMLGLWRRWLDYFKPSFHPWDHDSRDLLERWKAEYAETGAGAEKAVRA
ncbi:MAG: metal-dependent hydrolase, partial [Myxococcales bacterium]|nr:metal-dependent hydrolase [Myxococcales bacterium]